jgi:hypothetical protein
LKAQIGMSLDLRVASFMNRFPGKKISATTQTYENIYLFDIYLAKNGVEVWRTWKPRTSTLGLGVALTFINLF